MTPDEMIKKINARFAELKKMEQDCIAALQGKQADLNAILGAQQDCQYWLTQVMTGTAAPEFVPDGTPQPAPEAVTPATDENKDTVQ